MGPPLPFAGVLRIQDSHRTALRVRPGGRRAASEPDHAEPPDTAHPSVMHDDLVRRRVNSAFAPCWRLRRSKPELPVAAIVADAVVMVEYAIHAGDAVTVHRSVSAGENVPWRVRTRPPCYINYQTFPKMIEGHMISDVVAVLGSVNVIAAELDR